MKLNKTTLEKIEIIFKELSYTIRYEKGNFNSGYCIVEEKNIVVINRFFDVEARCNVLLDILSTLSVTEELLTEKSFQFYSQILKIQEMELKSETAA
jgi:hypothetical protein